MPAFEPTADERSLVKLLGACDYSHARIAALIGNRRGGTICVETLEKVFAAELEIGKAELDLMVLTQLMSAIKRGEHWAIQKYIDQPMWRPERGGWRARPHEVSLGGAMPEGSDLLPVQLVVSFEKGVSGPAEFERRRRERG